MIPDRGDRFAEWDAAYVLGALGPADRREYETHLSECADCAASVAELAGMPGLLNRAPASAVLGEPDFGTPPETLLPRLLAAARQDRRRRTVWTALVGGVAAVLVAVAVLVGVNVGGSSAPTARPVAMTAVRQVPVTATVQLEKVAWGTRVHLRCTYDGNAWSSPVVYRLVAVPRHGGATQQIARWKVLPGKEAVVDGSTDLATRDIASLRLEAADGTVLLSMQPSTV